MKTLITLAGLALPLLAHGTSHTAPAHAEEAKVRAVVDAAVLPMIEKNKLPGLAVGVTLGGKPYFFSYGVASLETRAPVTEHTIFELGSISKPLTATLGTYALAQGKLSLGDHPSRYVPGLKGSAVDNATLLNLGTYTAGGLPMQFPRHVAKADVETYFRTWKPSSAPGARRVYSNPSIGLFGHATARALERDFADGMENLIFPAFGMTSTYINVPPAAMGQYAWGYDEGKAVRASPGPHDEQAYGVKSSAVDLLRFVQANIDPARLDAPVRDAVRATHVPYFQIGLMVQGLGWEQYPYPVKLDKMLAAMEKSYDAAAVRRLTPSQPASAVLFHKTGSTDGFGAYAVFVPHRQIGIVMLANTYYPNPDRITAAQAILSALAP